jgi:hypothetical protein
LNVELSSIAHIEWGNKKGLLTQFRLQHISQYWVWIRRCNEGYLDRSILRNERPWMLSSTKIRICNTCGMSCEARTGVLHPGQAFFLSCDIWHLLETVIRRLVPVVTLSGCFTGHQIQVVTSSSRRRRYGLGAGLNKKRGATIYLPVVPLICSSHIGSVNRLQVIRASVK